MLEARPTAASWQSVGLENFEVLLEIGVNPDEHGRRQRVGVAVTMYRAMGAFTGGGLAACLDYGRVFRYVTEALPSRPHVELVEELAEDLVAFCLEDPRVEACLIRLTKPEAFGAAACPVVEVFRRRTAEGGAG